MANTIHLVLALSTLISSISKLVVAFAFSVTLMRWTLRVKRIKTEIAGIPLDVRLRKPKRQQRQRRSSIGLTGRILTRSVRFVRTAVTVTVVRAGRLQMQRLGRPTPHIGKQSSKEDKAQRKSRSRKT